MRPNNPSVGLPIGKLLSTADPVTTATVAAEQASNAAAAIDSLLEAARKLEAERLHADRCLCEATLALIAEVSRLNNGGAERPADSSIAAHCDQLQALARSYGYRIAKPSRIALVVKL